MARGGRAANGTVTADAGRDRRDGTLCTMTDGDSVDPGWLADFEAAARRPLATRWRYAFIRTHRPVLDDAGYRADTMADYRRWCEDNLPAWLGYGRVQLPPG